MKRKTILAHPASETRKKGEILTTQLIGDILVLNYWNDRVLQGRYCMNIVTGEYEYWDAIRNVWRQARLNTMVKHDPWCYRSIGLKERLRFDCPEDEQRAENAIVSKTKWWETDIFSRIYDWESDYSEEIRDKRRISHRNRIDRLMAQVPPMPDDFTEWLFRVAAHGQEYAFYDKTEASYSCTACGSASPEEKWKRAEGGKTRHNDPAICPVCGKAVIVKRRTDHITYETQVMLIQNMTSDASVSRHIDVKLRWNGQGKKADCSEGIRLVFWRNYKTHPVKIYYAYVNKSSWDSDSRYFDEHNPCNRRIQEAYLYPKGIREALDGTAYGMWMDVFPQLAVSGKLLDYNRLMIAGLKEPDMPRVIEYLFKGRFSRMLREMAANASIPSGWYNGPLNLDGECIEDVFDLEDRQKINRLRQIDGGEQILEWLRWSEDTGKKIDDITLQWLDRREMNKEQLSFILDYMSPCQIMHYIQRQQKESYKGKSCYVVLTAWKDYLSMCKRLGKHTEDEMIFRPRELKRRHDEAVEECRLGQEELLEIEREQAADRLRDQYPGAEEHLAEIRERYEYRDDQYIIRVPARLMEIMQEGAALHHCVGSSERYFERIMQKETYICFLRRAEAPDKPYYTIEFEPGGTIRQHRSEYDEEPDIEKIRGFLRQWQKEIKKRLNEEDRRLAHISAQKRQQNIDELKEKNNIRVLKGLEEDFMEAI